ncbi:potassium voltage-gated channel subfamily A member 10 [Brachionus plicatilis]|uniref:Potassium voltage-gated channel subfamily A member 10 n=1 Tax=Brachionus plicatilis TaxID=10195 RepID=A0A3M7Q9A0_BRAPC|nr:potassium voltage-gated channel subfamily A member 10 [Brachionus plicatilis]
MELAQPLKERNRTSFNRGYIINDGKPSAECETSEKANQLNRYSSTKKKSFWTVFEIFFVVPGPSNLSDAMYSSGVTSRHSKNRYESKSNKRKHIKKNDEQNGECMPTKIDYLNSRIRINISGKIFEVPESILNQYPLTLLGCYEERIQFYDCVRDEFFFDRNREAFEDILPIRFKNFITDILEFNLHLNYNYYKPIASLRFIN